MRKVLFLFSVLVLAACSNDVKLTLINQEESIDKYLNSTFKDSTVVNNKGSYRIVISADESKPEAESGDSLYLYYAGYVFTSSPSSIFATNIKEVAEGSGLQLTDPDYSVLKVVLGKGELIKGLEHGLTGTHEGEHCIIVFPGDLGFGNIKQYNIPKLSALAYEIWVEKVIKQ